MGELRLRPVEPADAGFLRELYVSTRDDLRSLPLPPAQLEQLIDQQHAAQAASHRSYGDQRHAVVELDGRAIGRLHLAVVDGTVRVVDITLAADARNQGLGTRLLAQVVDDAARARRDVTLHVARTNPARRLYERLGFVEVGADDVYLALRRPTV